MIVSAMSDTSASLLAGGGSMRSERRARSSKRAQALRNAAASDSVGGWRIVPLGEVIALVVPGLLAGLEDLGMDDVLVAQVADDDPVRQHARLVDHGRCRDDRWVLSVLIVHGFLRVG